MNKKEQLELLNNKKEELRQKIEDAKDLEELETIKEEIEEVKKQIEEITKEIEELTNGEKPAKEEPKKEEQEEPAKEEQPDQRSLLNEKLTDKEINKRNYNEKQFRKVNLEGEENMNKDKEILVRNAFANYLKGKQLKEEELRALHTLTSTSNEYVEPKENVLGINNGGVLIPESVQEEIIEKIEKDSPFLADLSRTNVKGAVVFPVRKKVSEVKTYAEKDENDDLSIEWTDLRLVTRDLSTTIPVSYQLQAMTTDAFLKYLTDLAVNEMKRKLLNVVLYGDGNIKGAVEAGAKEDVTVKSAIEALEKASLKTNENNFIYNDENVIYISADLASAVNFAKDKNGAYLANPLNGQVINAMGNAKVKVEKGLKPNTILVGDAKKYHLNFSDGLRVVYDEIGRKRTTEITTYVPIAGAPEEGAFAVLNVTIAPTV